MVHKEISMKLKIQVELTIPKAPLCQQIMGTTVSAAAETSPLFFCFLYRCAAGYWGEEDSGSPSLDKPIKSEDGACGGENSTESCCGTFGYMKERRAACVEDFKCTNDPCKV